MNSLKEKCFQTDGNQSITTIFSGEKEDLGLMSERICRTCRYDTDMYEQNFCTLRKDIVIEFAKEHLGFPDDFRIVDNWFMGLDPCEFYIENPLMEQLLSVNLDEEMGALGWRF